MSAFTFDDLLVWSERLPDWQRDALRRVLAGSLTDADIADLAAMARASLGLSTPGRPSPLPATKNHVRSSGASTLPVALVAVRDITYVNALASGPVTFAPEGLTVIYGDNASGKSGFARILKKAGRACEPGGLIRPSVFDPDPGKPASATIEFRVGMADRSFPWVDGAPTDDELARINVFDAGCAAVQVEESNRLASGIVLDDPVSSLDHHYRLRVARKLVDAAKQRQVVVFTHDIVFLLMLTKYARKAGVVLKERSLRRGGPRHGLPEEGPPWVAMTVGKRIGVLRSELQAAAAVLRKGDRAAYEQKAEWVYERLRQSWERAVEEVLLNEVVVRFGDGVSTQRLKALTDITDADVQCVDTEMTYCSSFVHDESGAVNAGIPDPPVVEATSSGSTIGSQPFANDGSKGAT